MQERMTNSIDFHGMTVEAAIRRAEQLFGEIRMEGNQKLYVFITGHGRIQEELLALSEAYGLTVNVCSYNSGAINVLVE